MKIKICGMKYADNISKVAALQPDFMGFIFYPASSRFVGYDFDENIVKTVPDSIRKVGVFVNESVENVIANKSTGCRVKNKPHKVRLQCTYVTDVIGVFHSANLNSHTPVVLLILYIFGQGGYAA